MKNLLIWLPRAIVIAYILFISTFALDAFEGDGAFFEKIGHFLLHLIPAAVTAGFLAVAWRVRILGGLTIENLTTNAMTLEPEAGVFTQRIAVHNDSGAEVTGARVFLTASLIENVDDLPGRGDGVTNQAGFLARRAALRFFLRKGSGEPVLQSDLRDEPEQVFGCLRSIGRLAREQGELSGRRNERLLFEAYDRDDGATG